MEPTPEDRTAQIVDAMNQGRRLRTEGQHAEAIAHFDRVIQQAPLFGTAYADRAAAKQLAGLEGALTDLDLAIALLPNGNPEQLASRHNRASHLRAQGNLGAALAGFLRAQALGWPNCDGDIEDLQAKGIDPSPTESETAEQLIAGGKAAFGAKKILLSLVLFQRAHDRQAHNLDAIHGLGIVNARLRRTPEAIEHFTQVIAGADRPERRAEALMNRAELGRSLGHLAQAVQDMEQCMALARDPQIGFPEVGSPEKNQAFVAGLEGRLDKARAALAAQIAETAPAEAPPAAPKKPWWKLW